MLLPAPTFRRLPEGKRMFVNDCRLLRQFLQFAGIGVINTLTDLLIFTVLNAIFGIDIIAANVVSYGCATCVSFFLNRNITFREIPFMLGVGSQFSRFVFVNIASLVLSTALVVLLSRFMIGELAKLVSLPFTAAWGFLLVRGFVFHHSPSRPLGNMMDRDG
jgi:putative flippase GtrA